MNQGYFFQLDASSLHTEGTILYRYLRVRRRENIELVNLAVPQYPIYLDIKSTAIDFFFHGIRSSVANDNIGTKTQQAPAFNHINIRILHLPLSKNIAVKDNLTSILTNCFDLKYELHKIYSTDYLISDAVNSIHYSNLEVFNPANTEEKREDNILFFRKLFLDFLFDLEHSKVFENSPFYEEAEIHLIENVFFHYIANKARFYYEWNQYQEQIAKNKQYIPGYYLINSEKQWLESCLNPHSPMMFAESGGWFEPVEDEVKNVIFNERRKKWINDLANHSNENGADEKKSIDLNKKLRQIRQTNKRLLIKISKWFLRRYNLDAAFASLLLNFPEVELRLFFLTLLIVPLCFWFVACLKPLPYFCKTIQLQFLTIGGYHALMFLVLIFKKDPLHKKRHTFLCYSIIGFILWTSINLLFNLYQLLSVSINYRIIFYIIITFLIPSLWICTTFLLKKRFSIFPFTLIVNWGVMFFGFCLLLILVKRVDIFQAIINEKRLLTFLLAYPIFILVITIIRVCLKGLLLSTIAIFLPRLIMTVSGAWFFISTSEEVLKATFDNALTMIELFYLLIIFIVMCLFIMIEIKNMNQAELGKKNINFHGGLKRMLPQNHAVRLLERSLVFLLFSLLVSIIIGVVFTNVLITKTLTRSGFFENDSCIHEIQDIKYPNDEDPHENLDAALTNLNNQNSRFLFLKNISHDHHEYALFNDKSILYIFSLNVPLIKYEVKIYILPAMLIYLSIFALFFGVFLQLIFEDKPVTEPL